VGQQFQSVFPTVSDNGSLAKDSRLFEPNILATFQDLEEKEKMTSLDDNWCEFVASL
jgi:hypothetical protein